MEPQPWRVLDRRYVYDRKPYMVMREDTVELPNGAQIQDYFVFEYPDWVSVLATTADGEFVLIRQYRHGVAAVHYELVAGVVDPQEPLLEAAKRELLEETGYGGGEWRLFMQASANPATHTNTSYTFVATGVRKIREAQLEATEDISVHLLTKPALLEVLRNGGFAQALHLSALWRFLYEM
jgi:8-oxo-dGTP pyrophosphatase MutT (NUDIX family)